MAEQIGKKTGKRRRWDVQMFERKRTPDLKSELVEVPKLRRKVPKDTIPRPLPTVLVYARKRDEALAEAKRELRKRGHEVASLSFSAETANRLVAYVFEKKERKP